MKQILIILTLILSTGLFGQERPLISEELGVLEAKIETYAENIVIYNQDGLVWMQFDFDYENKLENKNRYTLDDIKKLYNWNNDFNPYAGQTHTLTFNTFNKYPSFQPAFSLLPAIPCFSVFSFFSKFSALFKRIE